MLIICCLFFILFFRLSHSQNKDIPVQKMFTVDMYKENASLMYSGQSLSFACDCAYCHDFEIVDENGILRSVQMDLASSRWAMILHDGSVSEKFFCKNRTSGSISTPFQPPYVLCEEPGQLCDDMKCPDQSAGNRFCVVTEDDPRPSTCKPLPKTCDHSNNFGEHFFGLACVDKEIKSLCQAFANRGPVSYVVARKSLKCREDLAIHIPSLKKNVSVGFVGRLGYRIEFYCESKKCQWNMTCTEKTPFKTISEQFSVTKSFHMSAGLSDVSHYKNQLQMVSLQTIFVQHAKVMLKPAASPEKLECVFFNGVDEGDQRIKHDLKVYFFAKGSDTRENLLTTTFSVERCGVYVCKGTVKARQCNPFFEAMEVRNDTKEVKINCIDCSSTVRSNVVALLAITLVFRITINL